VVATHGSSPGSKLYGLDPATGVPRYTEMLPSAAVDHFASPSAAGGRLFVASGSSVTAYQTAALPASSPPAGPPAAPSQARGGSSPGSLAATLASTSLTVSASGRLVVKVRCPSAVTVCKGFIILRTLRAVPAGSAEGSGAQLARARSILLLASGDFAVRAGHVKAVPLRLRVRARRLLLRTHVLHAQATLSMRDGAGTLHTSRATVTLRLATRRRGP
jgi:hypothetical protein